MFFQAFLCFTTSPKYLGRNDLPINMQETMRPIALLKIDKVGVLNVLLKSFGITASHLPSYMVEQSDLCSSLLSTPKSLDMRQVYILYLLKSVKKFLAKYHMGTYIFFIFIALFLNFQLSIKLFIHFSSSM